MLDPEKILRKRDYKSLTIGYNCEIGIGVENSVKGVFLTKIVFVVLLIATYPNLIASSILILIIKFPEIEKTIYL